LQEKIGERYDKTETVVKELTEISGQLKTYKEQLAEFKDESLLKDIVVDINLKYSRIESDREKFDTELDGIEKKIYNRKKRKEILDQLNELTPVSQKLRDQAKTEIPIFKERLKTISGQASVRRLFDTKKKEYLNVKLKVGHLDLSKPYRKSSEDLAKEIAVLENKISAKEDFYSDLKKLNVPQCPTCKSSLDQAAIQKNLQSLQVELKEFEEKLPVIERSRSEAKKAADLVDRYTELKTSLDSLDAPESTVEELSAERQEIETKLTKCEELVDTFNQRSTIEQTLKNYPEEEMPDRAYYEKLKTKVNDLSIDLKVAIKEKSEYEYQLSQVISLSKKIKSAEEQLVDFEKIKNRLQLLDVLYVAYGDKGLKLKQITNLCKKLVERLGAYSHLMFQERNIKFSQNTEKENFDIVAVRNYAGKEKQIDISEFSGGERKRLVPGLVLAQRDLLPNTKKTNLLLLDELDANLDPIAKQAFVNNLLPLLKSKFESTVVVAHSPEMDSSIYDKRWRIERKNGQSKIHFGETVK